MAELSKAEIRRELRIAQLRTDARTHREIAAELERHAREIECHVACDADPTCVTKCSTDDVMGGPHRPSYRGDGTGGRPPLRDACTLLVAEAVVRRGA